MKFQDTLNKFDGIVLCISQLTIEELEDYLAYFEKVVDGESDEEPDLVKIVAKNKEFHLIELEAMKHLLEFLRAMDKMNQLRFGKE